MEERSEESTSFSVRVFTLQEEMTAEEAHMDTHEEVTEDVADGTLMSSEELWFYEMYLKKMCFCVTQIWFHLIYTVLNCPHIILNWSALMQFNLAHAQIGRR